MNNYETVVGLEIHVELATESKMFCRCKNPNLTDKPNTRTCPVCLGLPGALPYTNKKAIESCIKIAQALGCSINKNSFFERKNYFYPDLSKGFQTSQYLHPFGENGKLEIEVNGVKKTIGITRVHMEEDTGKLTHASVNGKEASLIDFNRSGVPLVEIVTEPDIRSGEEARIFLTKLQQIIRYLEVSDADMEKGHMRLEPNISLRPIGQTELAKYKVEVKNINSFRFVEKAIKFEEVRHKEMLIKGETPVQETRGWNEFKNKTVSQRSKEEAHDYRYFPEPDIPPIRFTQEQISAIKDQIGELPDDIVNRFIQECNLPYSDAAILTTTKALAYAFEEAVKEGAAKNISPKQIANVIINKKIKPEEAVKAVIAQNQTADIDEKTLETAIEKVLASNEKAVNEYISGKENAIMFLLGQTLRELGVKTDANKVKSAILKKLK